MVQSSSGRDASLGTQAPKCRHILLHTSFAFGNRRCVVNALRKCSVQLYMYCMTIWLPDPSTLSSPLHSSLALAIAKAISDGKLPKGTQLPTHRKLAEELGLSVHTVSKAYESLRRQRLIDGQVGRGSYVLDPDTSNNQPFQLSSERGRGFDLSISRPAFSQHHAELFQQALADLPQGLDPSYYLACRPNVGHDAHRAAGVKWLQNCGMDAPADQIIMTNGVSHGMSAALSALTRPGDTVVTSRITHHLLVSGCSYLGLYLAGVDTTKTVSCRRPWTGIVLTIASRFCSCFHLWPIQPQR